MLSILPFERVTRDRERDSDRERPFKAYPRSSATISSASASYYGPFTPPTFVGSVGIPTAHSNPHKRELAMDLRGAPPAHGMYDGQHAGLMDISQARGGHHGGHIKAEGELGYPSLSPTQAYPTSSGHPSMPQSASTMVPPTHPSPIGPTSSVSSTTHMEQANGGSSSSTGEGSPQGKSGGNNVPPKKRPLSVPEEMKDNAYWEKRKKNNESAKRSREARRMKEEQIAMRVVYLEQENLQLRTEVSLLKSEIEKLRCMLYNS